MLTWTEAEQRLAESLPAYESRPQQKMLAEAIEIALGECKVVIGQGGCGVGKSFALLIPLIMHALRTGLPAAVSTATKSLQDQYINKDLPFLLQHLGEPFTYAVVKGRGNYVCKAKMQELKPGDIQYREALVQELAADPTHSGDLTDLVTPIEPAEKRFIVSTSDECPGKSECPFGDKGCYAEVAKDRAKRSNIVVVNHAALITDLKIKQEGGFGLLPEFGAIGVDESHELESYATNALGAEVTQRGIENLANEAINLLSATVSAETSALLGAAERLFFHLKKLLKEAKERTVKFGDREALEAEKQLGDILRALLTLKKAAEAAYVTEDAERMRLKRLKKRINSMFDKFKAVVFSTSAELVRWIESDDKRGVVLKYAPLYVGEFLNEMIWERGPAALVSATVAIGNDFSFVAERHGIPAGYDHVDAGSPFDFEKQASLYIPDKCDPSADPANWRSKVRMQSLELIRKAGGRALLLFSSRANMQAMHDSMKESLEDMGLTVLIQGQGTVKQLGEKFKSDETSVLFGLKSFATGFDVPGDALRVVIIDKMPFPVPSDVIFAARAEAIDKAATNKWVDGAFPKLSVPSMALDLLQEAGRLIRTTSDEGLIAIFDSRLVEKRYGKQILKALPPARRVGTFQEASSYLEDLSSRRG
jgi:ATP-dependent DNA helicase DinG